MIQYLTRELAAFKAERPLRCLDLFVARFRPSKQGASFKLVLSGWKLDSERRLDGLLLICAAHGVQFNGIPVSFSSRASDDGAA